MDEWLNGLTDLGILLTKDQIGKFDTYLALLLEWNERMNLTAVRQPEAIKWRHFYDSLTCATMMGNLHGRRLIDIGTGAGFPGLPLKILIPNLQVTLVESVAKKIGFLAAIVEELSLSEVQIVCERAELLGQNSRFREQYDWAVARGVAEMRILVEFLLPFCRVGGTMLAQKGENAKIETSAAGNAIHLLGGKAPEFKSISVPGKGGDHFLVLINKVRETPIKYPRRVGVPAKRPL